MSNETILETQTYNASPTVVEKISQDSDATIAEYEHYASDVESSATISENSPPKRSQGISLAIGSDFHGYTVKKALPATGGEADIYVIEKSATQYILKLYRSGIIPKEDIQKKIKALAEKYPNNFVRIFEIAYEHSLDRYFEIQEYIREGSLQNVISNLSNLSTDQRKTLFDNVAKEVGQTLHILHKNNILHLDIKPLNILMRTRKPLNLVLIDFGISTSISEDLSKKMTSMKGTVKYQAPEAFATVRDKNSRTLKVMIGAPADWWGLGMILLEIAQGYHPFKGITDNAVAFNIATRPVEISDSTDIDDKQRLLLRGLLTRNPENRWNWAQVCRWLNGETQIEERYEDSAGSTDTLQRTNTTLNFMGKSCSTLQNFAKIMLSAEEAWQKGVEFLMRGYVRKWLEDTQQLDQAVELDNALDLAFDQDEKALNFINKFSREIAFKTQNGSTVSFYDHFFIFGKVIHIQLLALISAKALKREPLSKAEQKIIDSLLNGRLASLLDQQINNGYVSEKLRTLYTSIKPFEGLELSKTASMLDFYVHPEKFFCPFVHKGKISPYNVAQISSGLQPFELPMTLKEWQDNYEKVYIIPADILEDLKHVDKYHSSRQRLIDLKKRSTLIPRDGWQDDEAAKIQQILPTIDKSFWRRSFLDFLLYPQKYYCPAGTKAALKNSDITPMLKSELADIDKEFIIPADIVKGLKSESDYSASVAALRGLKFSGKLIPRNGYSEAQARTIAVLLPLLSENRRTSEYVNMLMNLKDYYCPFIGGKSDTQKIIAELNKLKSMPITKKEWKDALSTYFVPQRLINETKSAQSYDSAVSKILYSDVSKILWGYQFIRRDRYSAQEQDKIDEFFQYTDEQQENTGVIDFYLHREKYYCPFVNKKQQHPKDFAEAIRGMERLPLLMSEWKDLQKQCDIPQKIVALTHRKETYFEAFDEIEKRIEEKKRKTQKFSDDTKKYLEIFKADEAKSASRRLKLWITYLELMASKRVEVAPADYEILNRVNVALKEVHARSGLLSYIDQEIDVSVCDRLTELSQTYSMPQLGDAVSEYKSISAGQITTIVGCLAVYAYAFSRMIASDVTPVIGQGFWLFVACFCVAPIVHFQLLNNHVVKKLVMAMVVLAPIGLLISSIFNYGLGTTITTIVILLVIFAV